MATTHIDTSPWQGTPVIDRDKVEALINELSTVQRDADKAGDVEDACYWEGAAEAYRIALDILFGVSRDTDGQPVTTT